MARKITRRARRDDRSEEPRRTNIREQEKNTSAEPEMPDNGAGIHSTSFYVFSLINFYPIVIYTFLFLIDLKNAILWINMSSQALKIQKIPANLDVFGKKQRDLVTIR